MIEHWCACGEDINGHEWRDAAKRHLDLATEYRLRAEKAEAAIQRVREAATIRPNNLYSDPYYSGYVHACGNILRALDGGAE